MIKQTLLAVLIGCMALYVISNVFAVENSYSWVRPQNCSCVATGGSGGNWSYFNNTYADSIANFTYFEGLRSNFTMAWVKNLSIRNQNNVQTASIDSDGKAIFNNTEVISYFNVTTGNANITIGYIPRLNTTLISFNDKIFLSSDSANDFHLTDATNATIIDAWYYDSDRKQTHYVDTDSMYITSGGVAVYEGTYRAPLATYPLDASLPIMQVMCTGAVNAKNKTCINNSYYNMSQNCHWVQIAMNFTGGNKNYVGYTQVCYPTGVGWGGQPKPPELPNVEGGGEGSEPESEPRNITNSTY